MKKHARKLILAAVFSCAFSLVAAETYDSVMKAAADAKSVKERIEFYTKAVSLGTNEDQKFKALREGFDLSVKSKDNEAIALFGNQLAESKKLTNAERADIKYKAIDAIWNWQTRQTDGPPPKLWEDFLKMPGVTPEQEITALLKASTAYRQTNKFDKAVSAYEKIVGNPAANANHKYDALLALSECHLAVFRQDKAVECLNRILDMKEVQGPKKAKIYLLLGDTILTGSGYYFEPSEKDYAAAYDAYTKAADTKNAPKEIQEIALKKIADSYFERKQFQKAHDQYEEIVNSKKRPPSLGQWNICMQMLGKCKIELKDYEGAISCFDQTRKINTRSALGDVYRSLGQAYYKNKEYVLALGAYNEALEILENQEHVEDDRPKWCKGWINKIKWFTANAPQLDAAMKKRAQKLAGTAKAEGKTDVKNKAAEFKSASDGAKKPEAKKTQKKINIDNLDVESDILKDGLQ